MKDIPKIETTAGKEESDASVILIHPPAISKRYLQTKFMPYGMSALYAFLKEQGIPVAQFDFLMEYLFHSEEDIDYHNPGRTFSEQEFFSVLNDVGSHPSLIAFVQKYGCRIPMNGRLYGFSIVAYHQYWASLLLARHVRRANPDAVIVFGGPFITIKPVEAFVSYGVADYWVKGSGEIPLLMLHQLHVGKRGIAREKIPGIIYFEGDRLVQSPQATFPAEEECPPDFEGLDLETYRYDHPLTGRETLFLPYRISKGCPSRCSFCTGRLVDRYDLKSAEKTVSEVRTLADKYATDTFQFADASVNGSPRRLAELCDRLARDFPEIRWYSYAKVNGFTVELLKKVKRAGCFSLFWGVESAHQPTIRLLGKRFETEKMYDLIDASIGEGIKSYIHLIYNTPHESENDVAAFISLVERYIDSDLVVFLPQRFLLEAQSLMFENPARYGLASVGRVEAPLFEREQYIYGEVDGCDEDALGKKHQRHRELLRNHLDWIRYRNIISASRNRLVKRLPAKIFVHTGKYAEISPLARKLHDRAISWIQSLTPQIREQL